MPLTVKRVVIAIGGNALIKDEEHHEVYDQLRSAQETAELIADFIALGYEVVLTHGNGPQVGFILRRSELAYEAGELHFVPLKNCVADTQGAIGYQIAQTLDNELRRRGISSARLLAGDDGRRMVPTGADAAPMPGEERLYTLRFRNTAPEPAAGRAEPAPG